MANFPTPQTTYEPDDSNVPQGARDSFLSKIGAVAQSAFNALNNAAVKLTGDQSISGVKTFSNSPIVPEGSATQQAVNFEQLQTLDVAVVKKTGSQTISGVKTFSISPVVPHGENPGHAVNLVQMESAISSSVDTAKNDIKNNTLGGVKIKKITFTGWNMSSNDTHTIAHGLDHTKILGVETAIYNAILNIKTPIHYMENTHTKPGGNVGITPTHIVLVRLDGQVYDDSMYADASGSVIVFYET